MSDDNMDLCSTIWNHEIAMRRLLTLLRQSQSSCNDVECFNPGLPDQTAANDNSCMLMALCWVAVVFFLYLLRPSAIRNRESDMKPSRRHGNDEGDNPPASHAF